MLAAEATRFSFVMSGGHTYSFGSYNAVNAERVFATYLIETPLAVEQAAATLSGEQSSGTFVAVPGETEELKQRFAARVEKITPLEVVEEPSLPGCRAESKPASGAASTRSGNRKFQRAEIVVSWSVENMGGNLPVLVSTLQGNLYELAQFSGLKLMDLEVPQSFAQKFRGPKFGVAGCRTLTKVEGRPLIGTIIKPSIGLTPQQTGELVKTLAEAGIDFVKDDELMADPPHSPFDQRVDAVMRVINDHADRTEKKVMYAFNISDELDAMQRHYDKIVSAGGTCAMVSLNSVGLAGAKKICDNGVLAIHGHRNGWGALNRHPLLGMEFAAYQKLWRLAGVDQIHVNGIANKFWESDDSVVRSIESCLKPLLGGMFVLPVVSSGQWGGQAPETFRRTRTVDLLYMAGGGIMAHPDGPAAGVRSLQKWWEAAVEGLTMEQAATKYPGLGKSLAKFGRKGA
jgi:ribulose-bisphosphate carboxylase large chain